MGDAERQVEYKRVEEVVASGSIEHDLRRAMKVCIHGVLLGVPSNPSARSVKTPVLPLRFSSTTDHWT